MTRTIWTSALTLGAVLAVNGAASAGDDNTPKSGIGGGFTMSLGGSGTAAQAAGANDTELTFHRRHGYYGGGYYGGGYSYGGGYYGGGYNNYYCPPSYGGYYGGGYSYGGGYGYSRPYYGGGYGGYGGGYSYGGYGGYGGYRGHHGHGYYRIGGTDEDASAPVISLALNVANNPLVPTASRYDGGPSSPVPLPKPDAKATQSVPSATGLPVSLPTATPTSPFTYKAYGEK